MRDEQGTWEGAPDGDDQAPERQETQRADTQTVPSIEEDPPSPSGYTTASEGDKDPDMATGKELSSFGLMGEGPEQEVWYSYDGVFSAEEGNELCFVMAEELIGDSLHFVSAEDVLDETPPPTPGTFEAGIRRRFPRLFAEPTGVPPARASDMRLRLEPGVEPPAAHPYRLAPPQQKELNRQMAELHGKDWIRESRSPFAAPILFVKKGDGSLWLCVNYRRLNKVTVKDRFPMSHMEDLLARFHGATIFTKLDLKSGYHQQRLALEDRAKTAFVTPEGLYEWTVVPFRLANAPSAFMRVMSTLLQPHKAHAIVYMDDILIFSHGSEEDHLTTVT